MSICVMCGHADPGGGSFCSAHLSIDEGWAAGNRTMCDFLHRGLVRPAEPPAEPADLVVPVGQEPVELVGST